MTTRTALRSTLAFFAALLLSVSANAQLFRAYLAPTGLDTNPCTLPAPCRLLPAALAAVASGGEIWMLDSANYNTATVTIGKSVSILAVPGAVGSVVATGGPAISITAASLEVSLRNVVIAPLPGAGGTHGISMTGASTLTVENSLIANLPASGIYVAAGIARVVDTTLRGNDNSGLAVRDGAHVTVSRTTISGNLYGVLMGGTGLAGGTTTNVDIANAIVDGNGYGVFAWSTNASAIIKASVRDSQVVRTEGSICVFAESAAGAAVTLSVTNNIISNCQYAVGSWNAGSRVLVSGNTVTHNSAGFVINGAGVIESAGNNVVGYNTNNVSGGSLGTVSPM